MEFQSRCFSLHYLPSLLIFHKAELIFYPYSFHPIMKAKAELFSSQFPECKTIEWCSSFPYIFQDPQIWSVQYCLLHWGGWGAGHTHKKFLLPKARSEGRGAHAESNIEQSWARTARRHKGSSAVLLHCNVFTIYYIPTTSHPTLYFLSSTACYIYISLSLIYLYLTLLGENCSFHMASQSYVFNYKSTLSFPMLKGQAWQRSQGHLTEN